MRYHFQVRAFQRLPITLRMKIKLLNRKAYSSGPGSPASPRDTCPLGWPASHADLLSFFGPVKFLPTPGPTCVLFLLLRAPCPSSFFSSFRF